MMHKDDKLEKKDRSLAGRAKVNIVSLVLVGAKLGDWCSLSALQAELPEIWISNSIFQDAAYYLREKFRLLPLLHLGVHEQRKLLNTTEPHATNEMALSYANKPTMPQVGCKAPRYWQRPSAEVRWGNDKFPWSWASGFERKIAVASGA